MTSTDHLASRGDTYCFSKEGEIYVVYLKEGDSTRLDIRKFPGSYDVLWYNPRSGGEMTRGSISTVSGGQWADLGYAPVDQDQDWTILIRRNDTSSE